MRNFNPRSVYENERPIRRTQGAQFQRDFSGGMYDDLPVTPGNAVKYLKNYVNKGDRLDTRGGTKKWSDTELPSLRGKSTSPDSQTAYVGSSTVSGTTRTIVKTSGADFTSADIGRYFVNDSGVHEEILTVSSTTTITTRTSSSTEWTFSAGWVRASVNAVIFHSTENVIVILIGSRVYVSDDVNITGWTEVFCISRNSPASYISKFDEYDKYVILFNSNGVYRIDASLSSNFFWQLNTKNPSVLISDSGFSANGERQAGKPYGRRFMYSAGLLSGSGDRNRTTSGVSILHETGTVSVDSNNQDYGTHYQARPYGLASTTYGLLTGASLSATYGVTSGWALISDGQFTITINGTTKNVTCDFTSVVSMAEVAERIQLGLRDFSDFSTATCTFDTDHFVITAPDDGGTITVVSAGNSGTDIGTSIMKCESGSGTVTNPRYTNMANVGTLTCPTDASGNLHKHHNYYPVYATLDIGPNGIDPISGNGNDTELFVWLNDIPMARAYTAAESAGNIITLNSGMTFDQYDVGATLEFQDGTTSVIQYLCDAVGTQVYTQTSRYAIGNAGSTSSQSAAIGGGDVMTAVQTVTGSEIIGSATIQWASGSKFASTDVGATVFWSDLSESHIVRFIDTENVEVAESTAISSSAATINPVSREFSDYTTEFDLRSRISAYPLRQRFWEPLPAVNTGEVSNGFIFAAVQGGNKLHYSQIPYGFDYLGGYYNPAYQFAVIKGDINDIIEFPDAIIIFCAQSTHKVPTNVYSEVALDRVGEVINVISGQTILDHDIGASYGGISKIDETRAVVVTTEPAVRVFDGYKYGDNLYQDRLMRKLRALQGAYATSYDLFNGHILWGLDEA